MKFNVERLSNEPILIVTIYKDYVVGRDSAEIVQTVDSKIGKEESGLYSIYDLRDMKMTFGELVLALSNQSQRAPGAMADPRTQAVIVGSSELVRFGAEAFKQEQYGNLKFPLFETLDEALVYARTEVAKRT
jgi:hypothetical protein